MCIWFDSVIMYKQKKPRYINDYADITGGLNVNDAHRGNRTLISRTGISRDIHYTRRALTTY